MPGERAWVPARRRTWWSGGGLVEFRRPAELRPSASFRSTVTMSLLRLACQQCIRTPKLPLAHNLKPSTLSTRFGSPDRLFSTSHAVLARKQPKARPQLSKKALAAKARRKAAKARKNIYDNEKMPLVEAINVLRVRGTLSLLQDHINHSTVGG